MVAQGYPYRVYLSYIYIYLYYKAIKDGRAGLSLQSIFIIYIYLYYKAIKDEQPRKDGRAGLSYREYLSSTQLTLCSGLYSE